MTKSSRIFTPPGLRVVIAAWLIALAVASVLACCVGNLQLRRIDRELTLSIAEEQSDRLYELIVPLYNQALPVVEQELLKGQAIVGDSYTLEHGDPWTDADERSLFRFTHDGQAGVRPATGTRIMRARIEARSIDPRFSDWTVRLKFVDDRLQGASAYNPRQAAARKPVAGEAVIQKAAEWTVVIAAGLALLCLAGVGPIGDLWRRQLASVGLAAGLLVVVAAALHPAPYRRPVLHRPHVLGAWALVIATLGLSAIQVRRRRPLITRPTCRCGYDLTGNVSGVCPECGTPTARGRVDRWAEVAEALEHTQGSGGGQEPQRQTATPIPLELKWPALMPSLAAPLSRFASRLSDVSLKCYRLPMTDARDSSSGQAAFHRSEFVSDVEPPPATDTGPDAADARLCPHCDHPLSAWRSETGDESEACPTCGGPLASADVGATEQERAEQEERLRQEVEQRTRAARLDDVRVKQVLTERRSLFRMRSYFVALAVTAAVAAGQLGIWAFARITRGGLDLFVVGYLVAIAGLVAAAIFAVGRVRRYTAELAIPVQRDPIEPPDFSTLSDGSHRLDEAAQALERLNGRGQP